MAKKMPNIKRIAKSTKTSIYPFIQESKIEISSSIIIHVICNKFLVEDNRALIVICQISLVESNELKKQQIQKLIIGREQTMDQFLQITMKLIEQT